MAATYVKPGELGLNPEKLTEMLTELEQTVEIHSISVRFDGKVILEVHGSRSHWRSRR